jgi:AraC family transcriptional regulator, regulatory protein of adaptative response / methylated-DNA-[protein]-cysteine methyltransferase
MELDLETIETNKSYMSAASPFYSLPSPDAGLELPLKTSYIETPLGKMLTIADEKALYLLEFSDWRGLDYTVEKLCTKTGRELTAGDTPTTQLTRDELAAYFKGKTHSFQTPLSPLGTLFQRNAWEALIKVPYGTTHSYRDQAAAIGNPLAVRAVARANATNPIAIIIPCHRIINHNGQLGGYGGGLDRKQWLLSHEKKHRL